MVIVLTGPNGYALQNDLQHLKQNFVKQYGDLAVERIDVSDFSLAQMIDTLSARPFLSEKRLLVVDGLATNKTACADVESWLKFIDEQTEAVIVEPKIDKRSVWYKTLKKLADVRDFQELDVRDAPRWLVEQASLAGGKISLADASYLVQRVGSDQQQLSSELSKIMQLNKNVTRSSVTELTVQAPQSSIFELIEAAFSGDIKRALALYDDQRAQNVEPLAIEALFVWQLHALLLVKLAGQIPAETIASQTAISPYVVKKSIALVRTRTYAQLKNYVAELEKLEYQIKTTSVNADELIKSYILLLAV